MKRPEKVKLGCKNLKIVYKPDVVSEDGKACFGLASYTKGEIYISEDKDDESNVRIAGLLHELIHMVDVHYMTELTENQISMLTVGLGDLAAQNPGLMKYVFEK